MTASATSAAAHMGAFPKPFCYVLYAAGQSYSIGVWATQGPHETTHLTPCLEMGHESTLPAAALVDCTPDMWAAILAAAERLSTADCIRLVCNDAMWLTSPSSTAIAGTIMETAPPEAAPPIATVLSSTALLTKLVSDSMDKLAPMHDKKQRNQSKDKKATARSKSRKNTRKSSRSGGKSACDGDDDGDDGDDGEDNEHNASDGLRDAAECDGCDVHADVAECDDTNNDDVDGADVDMDMDMDVADDGDDDDDADVDDVDVDDDDDDDNADDDDDDDDDDFIHGAVDDEDDDDDEDDEDEFGPLGVISGDGLIHKKPKTAVHGSIAMPATTEDAEDLFGGIHDVDDDDDDDDDADVHGDFDFGNVADE